MRAISNASGREVEMADEMMVLIRFGGNADDLLPRYLGAVTRWREDDATKISRHH